MRSSTAGCAARAAMLPRPSKATRFVLCIRRHSSALWPLMRRSMSNSASMRLTASRAIGEIAAAFLSRLALAAMSASSKNCRLAWTQQNVGVTGPCAREASCSSLLPLSASACRMPVKLGDAAWCHRREAARQRGHGARSAHRSAVSRRTGADLVGQCRQAQIDNPPGRSARTAGSRDDAGQTSQTGSWPAGSARRSRATSRGKRLAARSSSRSPGAELLAHRLDHLPLPERFPASLSSPQCLRPTLIASMSRSKRSSAVRRLRPARAANGRGTVCVTALALEGPDGLYLGPSSMLPVGFRLRLHPALQAPAPSAPGNRLR